LTTTGGLTGGDRPRIRKDRFFRNADPSSAPASAVTDKVTLVRKSIQVTKTYEADDGPSWLLLFENDLKQGAFG